MKQKNFDKFEKTFFVLILIILVNLASALKPIKLTKKIYQQKISKSYDNIHYFVVTSKSVITPDFLNAIQAYSNLYKLELYQCNPTDAREYCPLDGPIFLIINTIRIEFNGHREHPEDLLKWIRFRIQQFPRRIHSVQELREYVSNKNEIFCFIDRQGQQMTKKQYIFIATAKKLHFLHYCCLDISIAKQLSLKEGHLALIRHDLSYNFDYWSEKTHEDSTQLHQLWLNFLISSCESDFRVLNRNKNHDLVIIDCDLSLECQQSLYQILLAELKWRQKHPQVNFKINLLPKSSKYESTGHEKKTKFPVFKFAKTIVEKRIVHQEQSGAVLEETDYIRDTYKMVDPIVNQNTIDMIIENYKNKKLRFVIRNVETDIRSLDGEEGKYHRQLKRKEKERIEQL